MTTPTREELLKLAEKAGAFEGLADNDMIFPCDALERFATLVCAHQARETMDARYGDRSDHPVCNGCGLCISCGDCEKEGCGWKIKSEAQSGVAQKPASVSGAVDSQPLVKALQFYADGLTDDGSVARVALWAVKGGAVDSQPSPVTDYLTETVKEAFRDISRIEIHLEKSKAPTDVRNITINLRCCIRELNIALSRAQAAQSKVSAQRITVWNLNDVREHSPCGNVGDSSGRDTFSGASRQGQQ